MSAIAIAKLSDLVTWKMNLFILYYLHLLKTELRKKTDKYLMDVYSSLNWGKVYSSHKFFDDMLFPSVASKI